MENSLTLNSNGISLSAFAVDAKGNTTALSEDGFIKPDTNGYIALSLSGLKPSSPYSIYVRSNPILLGTYLSDVNGNLIANVPTTLPKNTNF